MSDPKSEFENSLTLWLPDAEEIDPDWLRSLHRCHTALDEMMRGEISFQGYCDVLATEGVDMDIYLETAHQNCLWAGL